MQMKKYFDPRELPQRSQEGYSASPVDLYSGTSHTRGTSLIEPRYDSSFQVPSTEPSAYLYGNKYQGYPTASRGHEGCLVSPTDPRSTSSQTDWTHGSDSMNMGSLQPYPIGISRQQGTSYQADSNTACISPAEFQQLGVIERSDRNTDLGIHGHKDFRNQSFGAVGTKVVQPRVIKPYRRGNRPPHSKPKRSQDNSNSSRNPRRSYREQCTHTVTDQTTLGLNPERSQQNIEEFPELARLSRLQQRQHGARNIRQVRPRKAGVNSRQTNDRGVFCAQPTGIPMDLLISRTRQIGAQAALQEFLANGASLPNCMAHQYHNKQKERSMPQKMSQSGQGERQRRSAASCDAAPRNAAHGIYTSHLNNEEGKHHDPFSGFSSPPHTFATHGAENTVAQSKTSGIKTNTGMNLLDPNVAFSNVESQQPNYDDPIWSLPNFTEAVNLAFGLDVPGNFTDPPSQTERTGEATVDWDMASQSATTSEAQSILPRNMDGQEDVESWSTIQHLFQPSITE